MGTKLPFKIDLFDRYKNIFQWFYFGNINLAILASLISYLSIYDKNLSQVLPIILLIFSGTLGLYSFDKLMLLNLGYQDSLSLWTSNNIKGLYLLLLFSGGFFLVSILQLPIKAIFKLAPSVIISILYSFETVNKKPLRTKTFLKTIIIAINWSYLTMIWPILATQSTTTFSFVLLFDFISMALIAFAITFPFDIFDIQADAQQNIKTWAQLTGKKKGIILSCIIALCAIILTFYFSNTNKVPLLISGFYAVLLIIRSNYWKSKINYLIWLDGTLWIYVISHLINKLF